MQYECWRYAITLTRAPHTPSEKMSKQSEVWIRWANEWFEQESTPWFYKIPKKILPSTAKQELVTTFINSFQRSMGEDSSASHLESKEWKGKFWNNAYAYPILWTLDFAWSSGSVSTLFARDEQNLGVGVCWRSFLVISTANIPSDFRLSAP